MMAGQANRLGAPNRLFPDASDPFAAAAPTQADAVQYTAQAYQAWLDQQRQSGVASGMIDPQTGWPTGNALLDAARQYGGAMIGGTSAPGMKGATMENPAFAKWFGASKAVDDAGGPLTLYHGSGAKNISEFKPKMIGSANDPGFYGRGYYFAADKELAQDYVPQSGGKVHETHLSVQNPFVWDLSTPPAQADTIARVKAIMPEAEVTTTGIRVPDARGATSKTSAADWTAALQKAGHDGLFIMAPRNYDAYQAGDYDNVGQQISEAIAFDPRQIKSATGNRGTFDPNDPRLKYGVGGLAVGAAAAGQQTQ